MKGWMVIFGVLAVASTAALAQDAGKMRQQRNQLESKGRWRELVDQYTGQLSAIADEKSPDDLAKAVAALAKLGAWAEADELVEGAVALQPGNAPLLTAAAAQYRKLPHHGRIVGGKFERSQGGWMPWRARGGDGEDNAGEPVNVTARDRARGLQLALQAVHAAADDPARAAAWTEAAALLMLDRAGTDAWKLQVLTAIDRLPAWTDQGPQGGTEGAPWRGEAPVLYQSPPAWDKAANDGERWRFALAERARLAPAQSAVTLFERAEFLRSQFGVGTLAGFGWWRTLDPDTAKGLLEMDSLAEDECLAKTSDGVRRFKLPPEHHFIALYRELAAGDALAEQALGRLVEIFLDRRQRAMAAAVLTEKIRRFKPAADHADRRLLAQVTGNWARFENVPAFPAGRAPKLPFVFRNARSAGLSVAPLDVDRLLRDIRAYLESNPRELEHQRINPAAIGWRIVQENETKYLGKATTWDVALDPRDAHRDTRTEIEVPVDRAGAWLVKAELPDGNTSRIVIWLNDTALLNRPVGNGLQWWTADAVTGAPVGGAAIDFFGFRIEQIDRKLPLGRRFNILTKSFQRTADADGRVLLARDQGADQFQWLAIAKKDGRSAFHGFDGFRWQDPGGDQLAPANVFGMTDRPLYQAGDTVHLKFWLAKVAYDFDGKGAFAGRECEVLVHDGTGQQVVERQGLRLDEWGGLELDFAIPKDARLGGWQAVFRTADSDHAGTIGFQVEEFRKPEYEVTVDAPGQPVRLGDTFDAVVRATYFHGAPVTQATVKVKVTRASLGERWFPAWRWDWLYEPGAWWPMPIADWHPAYGRWGCILPHPPWWGGERWTPDEMVLEKTIPLGHDGTAKVTVDTAPAKQIHGDLDARYTISAEVIDASRRSEHGSGTVTAARRPFEVVVWLDRGWARPNQTATAEWSAATLDGKPVKRAAGKLELFRLAQGPDGRSTEESVRTWDVATDDEGRGTLRFELPAEGQYRLAAKLTAAGGSEAVEGATVVGVHGPANQGGFRFGPLEIVADKISYRAGETARLRVQSDRPDASVWLFLRAEGQGAREARRIDLSNGSAEVEVPLALADMPNIFVEGVTVHGGAAHTAVRQLLLPPESRMLGVDLDAPNKVKPRDKSRLALRVTDADGKPFQGTAVVTVYDKALEAIVGGSNVPAIDAHFWSWRRNYWGGSVNDSLARLGGGNLAKPKETPMQMLGRFGDEAKSRRAMLRGAMNGGGGGIGATFSLEMADGIAPAAPATAAPMAAEGMTAGTLMMAKAAPQGGAAAGAPQIVVRKDFADLVKWAGTVTVGADGIADLPVEFPDNLTTWKAKVWVLGAGTRVGEGSAEIVASKDLLVRLQAPRFLVETDEAVLSAIVHNYRDAAKQVAVSLDLPGGMLEQVAGETRTVKIEPGGEARVDWRVRALKEGEAVVRMTAKADDDGDAMERTLPVLVHGMLRQDAWSRVIDPDADRTTIDITVPEKRRPEQTKLTVRFSPTVAGAVVDAIPYLADYPYGCTEQTLNRFVPAVIARRMLGDLGIDLEALRARRANLNPQELGDPAARAAQWKQSDRNPVFDPAELDKMVAQGLARLAEMQNSDGGWGWFSGWGESSWPHTTAVVVHGLLAAKAVDAPVDEAMLKRGLGWLQAYEKTEVRRLERHVAEMKKPEKQRRFRDTKAHADATDALLRRILGQAGRDGREMLSFLVRDRLELPVQAQCLLGLELHRTKDLEQRDETLATIEQFRKTDPENQTTFLELPNQNCWWFWHGGTIETHTWYLQLLNAVKPKAAETRGLVKYLVNNRKHATWWDSTRDTAYAVEAIAGFLKASGEDAPAMEVDILLDGKPLRTVKIDKENLFTVDNTVVVAGDALAAGPHKVEIVRRGKGPVYANAYLEVFTLEDKLRAAGLEVKIARTVRKLTPVQQTTAVPDAVGLVTDQQVEAFQREDLADGATVASGDLLEVELVIASKNDYEYLVFEDWKPAGCEAVRALSGYLPGQLSAFMEPRNEKVAFFVRALPRGTHTITYRLRAETPGTFHALPARAEPMYAPELRANSDSILLDITEAR